jgi:outer membrane protein, heavy metal efflux system
MAMHRRRMLLSIPGSRIMAYGLALLLSLLAGSSSAWAQSRPQVLAPPAALAAATAVPRQLTLEMAEQLLLQHNLTISAARYGVDNAQAQRQTASVRPNPTLTLGAEGFDIVSPGNITNRLFTVRLDQVFERGNKRALRTEAAEFQVQAADAQVLDATRLQLMQLRQAFSTALLARDNVRVAEENLRLTNDTERLITARVKAGDAPAWDLIKFQTNKVQFQRDLTTTRLAYQQAVRDVLSVLGIPLVPGEEPPLLDVIGDLWVPGPVALDTSLEALHQQASLQRPDVQVAQKNLDAAQRTLELARAQRRRDVDVAVEYQRNGGDNTVGVTMSVPLFWSHKFEGQINQGLAQRQQTNITLEQTRQQVLAEVDKAYQMYQASRHLLQVYTTEALARAEESLRIATASYRQGATSLLELQEAQRTLNQTRLATNQAFFDYRMSLYQLEQAVGAPLRSPDTMRKQKA